MSRELHGRSQRTYRQAPSGGATGHCGGDAAQGLDPMAVVLSGMAQLQSVVKEMASPKNDLKPEVIKPGW